MEIGPRTKVRQGDDGNVITSRMERRLDANGFA